ncbi:hypothetical protein SAMN05444401_1622 [Clostridium amylolyticum]|uniref:ABC-2 family transporter protein n=1 Tax=Clostridium amylolyticum TaxID=1121298 RepID=A0A1M6EM27_9CLOT|nr:hypothetical protein [Clostridium amylolyticum]SHI86562.1 hypothetical protein SAMN05444401_1622 [Clostridium amylolyticum]
MLGKLLKYETKATARMFLPLYAALLVFAVINRTFISINSSTNVSNTFMNISTGISMFLYVFIIIAIFVLTFVVMIQRFYKNLLTDEGYLMFTLPVKPWLHIISKLMVSIMWDIVSTILTIVSVIILAGNKEMFTGLPQAVRIAMSEIYAEFSIAGYDFILRIGLMMLLSLIGGTLMIYASIAIGQLISKHKLLGAFGAFLLLNTASQIIVTTAISIAAVVKPNTWFITVPPRNMFNLLFTGATVLNLIFIVVYFIITNYILSHKLNLE